MNVRSTVGRGSCFEAWVPASPGTGQAAPDVPRASLPLGRGETVLVIVSDHARLLGAEEMLAALGYEPVGFERPDEALGACRTEPGRFDAILIACRTSLADNLAVARSLREILPRRPVLLAAMAGSDVRADVLAAAGVTEILREPLVSSELAATLAHCLRPMRQLRP